MDQQQIEQGNRLQKLIKALNLNQASFARSLGTTQPNISRMVSGGSAISAKVLSGITETHKNVNLHWLLTGAGAMFFAPAEENPPQVKEAPGDYIVRGKGKLEELEERLERLEEAVSRLLEERKKNAG